MGFSTHEWAWLGDFLKRRGLPGVAIAVTDRECGLSFTAKGWAERRMQPIDESTLFELGSIGKTFTALVTLQLAEEGRVDLHAPVTEYLPWFQVRSEFAPIAIEHLLTHSAGVVRGPDVTADSPFDVWALRETDTGFAPGERHYYSNVGYRTLGYALEAVTEQPYRELVRARVLEPLGLRETEPAITNDVRLRLAVGYDRLHDDRIPDPRDPLVPAPWMETDTADGCLASTAGDLAAFGRVLLGGPAKELTSGLLLESGDGWRYGYGLELKDSLFRHGGSMPGYSSTLLGDLDAGLAVAVLMNGPDEHDATEELADYALRLHRGETPTPPGDPEPTQPKPLAEPRKEWAPFYGRFRSYDPWLLGFRIVQWDDGIGLVFWWGLEEPLTQTGEAEFRVGADEWSPERLRFDAVVDGKALRANLSGGNYYRSDFP